MIKRISFLVMVALIVVALAVAPATAKQKTEFSKGQTTTHQGNSTNSPVVDCHHGAPNSKGSDC